MTEISRSSLFGKLNSVAYKAIEGATVFCKLRGNPYVELVHWIQQILQTPDSDLHRIARHFELDSSRLAKDVSTRSIACRAGRARSRICPRTSRMPWSAVGSTRR